MSIFNRLAKRAYTGAEVVVALLLGSMFVTFILQIIFRYVLSLPIGWTVEWVAIAWLWGILFGYAFVVRDRDIIRLDIVYAVMPEGVRRAMDVITGLTAAAILAWTLPKCWEYVDFMKIERTAYLRWPMNFIFMIYIPFAVAIIVRSLLSVWSALLGKTHAKIAPEGHDYD